MASHVARKRIRALTEDFNVRKAKKPNQGLTTKQLLKVSKPARFAHPAKYPEARLTLFTFTHDPRFALPVLGVDEKQHPGSSASSAHVKPAPSVPVLPSSTPISSEHHANTQAGKKASPGMVRKLEYLSELHLFSLTGPKRDAECMGPQLCHNLPESNHEC